MLWGSMDWAWKALADTSFSGITDGKIASTAEGWFFLVEKSLKGCVETSWTRPNTP